MMIDFFDNVYTQVSSIRNAVLRKGGRFIVRIATNAVIPVIYKLTGTTTSRLIVSSLKEKKRLIVSLTSFPGRIGKLHIVCEALLRQSKKPDIIIVWLSNTQFSSLNCLPKKLLALQDRGVQIRLVDEDIRSHKKYYYALSEFPNDYLLIVDDDIFYRSTMIEDLVNYERKYPGAIIAQYGRRIERNATNLLSYDNWKQIKDIVPAAGDVFFGSGGGTLIPPYSLFEDVCCKELFLKLTPYADDVWLNAMARLQKTKIVKTKYYTSNIEIMYKKNRTLSSINNDSQRNMNDVQIENLSVYYGEKLIW